MLTIWMGFALLGLFGWGIMTIIENHRSSKVSANLQRSRETALGIAQRTTLEATGDDLTTRKMVFLTDEFLPKPGRVGRSFTFDADVQGQLQSLWDNRELAYRASVAAIFSPNEYLREAGIKSLAYSEAPEAAAPLMQLHRDVEHCRSDTSKALASLARVLPTNGDVSLVNLVPLLLATVPVDSYMDALYTKCSFYRIADVLSVLAYRYIRGDFAANPEEYWAILAAALAFADDLALCDSASIRHAASDFRQSVLKIRGPLPQGGQPDSLTQNPGRPPN